MPDIALDLRYLRYAILAAEHGSFRRAAELLSVSQSTVSRRIQILERRVGLALFERHRSGARTTLAGERFLREAIVGARHLHQAADAVADAKRGSTGALRIGLTACLSNGFLPELLKAYHRRYPAIEVYFEEGTSQTSTGALRTGRLDVAFVIAGPQLESCRSVKLWEEPLHVAVNEAHAIASSSSVSWDAVMHETFLVMADAAGPEIEDYLVRQLSGSGNHPTISVQNIGYENLLSMVAQGFGVTLVTSSPERIAYPGIRMIPIAGANNKLSFSAVWSTKNQNPALRFLIDMSLERLSTAKAMGDAPVRHCKI